MKQERLQILKRKLQESRLRLVKYADEFAYPLWEMRFVATEEVTRISTNGHCIYFDPDWLQKLGPTEIDFILAHQLMHIKLGHIRRPKYYSGDRFHLACDIVANSHLGLMGWQHEKLPRIGQIYRETFFPVVEGHTLTPVEALNGIPFDPAAMKPGVRRTYRIDSEEWWDKGSDRGESGRIVLRPEDPDPEDLQDGNVSLGEYGAAKRNVFSQNAIRYTGDAKNESLPQSDRNRPSPQKHWENEVKEELLSLRENRQRRNREDGEDGSLERFWQRTNDPRIHWKKLLNSFLQEEMHDYSFTPPDRRLQDQTFFLPDYNVLPQTPMEVLFMVDTSGSIDEEDLSTVYCEICGALTQFEGGLVGRIGFFDTQVRNIRSFTEIGDLLKIVPAGGGGTDFGCIFDHIRKNSDRSTLSSIVIFTDGKGEFPEESAADNIPVLWLFSRREATAPWGKCAFAESSERS